ncbi:MAG: hypothetical protein OXR66_06860 [Candidatus Woesearchaeota archaeon]|nr:hypothetical protein [Candidatus Woesearchaeota archaeon]
MLYEAAGIVGITGLAAFGAVYTRIVLQPLAKEVMDIRHGRDSVSLQRKKFELEQQEAERRAIFLLKTLQDGNNILPGDPDYTIAHVNVAAGRYGMGTQAWRDAEASFRRNPPPYISSHTPFPPRESLEAPPEGALSELAIVRAARHYEKASRDLQATLANLGLVLSFESFLEHQLERYPQENNPTLNSSTTLPPRMR